MARSPQTHIANALQSLAKAQQAMQSKIDVHSKIIASQGQDIAALESKVQELRDCAIKADLAAGLSGRETAAKYGLSEGRVSQIRRT
jgi:glycerol-3-phosphate responsive antiterminator